MLPSIRQHGMYVTQELLDNPDLLIQVATEIKKEREKRLLIEKQAEEMKPKADYFDDLVARNTLTNFRDTAKLLKIKQNKFIQRLIDDKYIYRNKQGKLRPSASKNDGLFELKEFTFKGSKKGGDVQTLITPKGIETFRSLYSKRN